MRTFEAKVQNLFIEIVDNGGENLQFLYSDKENDFSFYLYEVGIKDVNFNFMDVLTYAFIKYVISRKVNIKKLTVKEVKQWLYVCLKTDYIYHQ
nr:MAG TPA: hypothetical protein [Caudoviricetes sp.]